MKKITTLLSCVAFLISLNVNAQTLKFENTIHDFGDIQEQNGKVTCTFNFTNEGMEPLVLSQVRPSCGCTASEWTKEPVLPGEKGYVKATFNPSGRPGQFYKSITVSSNDSAQPTMALIIKGQVIPKPKTKKDYYPVSIGNLRFASNHLAFMDMKNVEVKTDTMKIYNDWTQPMTLEFKELPAWLQCKAVPQTIKPEEEGYILITYNANKRGDWGLNFDNFRIHTNDAVDPVKTLTASAIIKEDFSQLTPKQLEKAPKITFKSEQYDYGTVKKGTSVEYDYEFINEGKSDLIIRKVKAACGCTATKPEKTLLKKGESSKIGVTLHTAGLKDRQHKIITVITNDPQRPEIILHILGTVED